MKHEEFHELLALRLYGEVSAEEEHGLQVHLATCGDCSRFWEELQAGLGALQETSPSPDLPADWDRRLREVRLTPGRRPTWSSVATFAAGLAAGMLVMTLLNGSKAYVRPSSAGSIELASEEASRHRYVPTAEAPAPAALRGSLSRLHRQRQR